MVMGFQKYIMACRVNTIRNVDEKKSDCKTDAGMNKRTEYVTVNAVPIRVDSWGGHLPTELLENPEKKLEELILIVPGNPGITTFYDDFLRRIHEKTKKPVWILSHAGHDKSMKNRPPLRKCSRLYNLEGQIEQKRKFIETYLKGVKLILVGHSIGCKMILELLKSSDIGENTRKGYFLFPTIERMADSPNGKFFVFAYKYIYWLILFGSCVFAFLPRLMQVALLRGYLLLSALPSKNVTALLELIHPRVVESSLFLADDEMKSVRELDHDTLERNRAKLKLYYGASDGWVPLRYYTEMKLAHASVDAEVCSQGFQHAFVLRDSIAIADMLSSWIML